MLCPFVEKILLLLTQDHPKMELLSEDEGYVVMKEKKDLQLLKRVQFQYQR